MLLLTLKDVQSDNMQANTEVGSSQYGLRVWLDLNEGASKYPAAPNSQINKYLETISVLPAFLFYFFNFYFNK